MRAPNILSRLTRITTAGRNYIPQIDGLRFVAIMAVIAYHLRGVCLHYFGIDAHPADPISRCFEAGHYGVQLFFAISGFVLSLPFARQLLCSTPPQPPGQAPAVSLKEYYLRRLTRIEPPYVIHLVVLLMLCVLVYRRLPAHPHLYHNPEWAKFTATHLLASLIYSNGFIFGTHPYPNYVLWSLEVEVQFYLLAPWLAKMLLVRNATARRILLLGLVGVFSVGAYLWQPYRVWASLAGNLQYFLVGFLLSDLYVKGKLGTSSSSSSSSTTKAGPGSLQRTFNNLWRSLREGWLWDAGFLSSCAAVVWLQEERAIQWVLPWAIFVCGVAAFLGVASRRFLGNPWITTIGGMCYTIYLYHSLMISLLARLLLKVQTHLLPLDLLTQFVLMSAAIIAVCAVLFAWLERPFMRRDWPRRLREKFRS